MLVFCFWNVSMVTQRACAHGSRKCVLKSAASVCSLCQRNLGPSRTSYSRSDKRSRPVATWPTASLCTCRLCFCCCPLLIRPDVSRHEEAFRRHKEQRLFPNSYSIATAVLCCLVASTAFQYLMETGPPRGRNGARGEQLGTETELLENKHLP